MCSVELPSVVSSALPSYNLRHISLPSRLLRNIFTDGQDSLDRVTIRDYWIIWENEGEDPKTITPTTLGEEYCSPTPAPTTAPTQGNRV